MENKTVPALDLIRFAAAAMVVWFHLAYWSWARPTGTTGRIAAGSVFLPQLAPTAQWGWVGVEIFFVISGFVICNSAAGKSAGQFAIARFVRLYPAVWLCAPISLCVLILCGESHLGGRFVHAMLLYPLPSWVDGVYWTLGIEMVFYGVIWILLLCRGFDYVQWVLIAVGLPSAVIWYLAHWFPAFEFDFNRYLELALLRHGCFFALGGLIFLNCRDGNSLVRVSGILFFAGACFLEIANVATGASRTAMIIWAGAIVVISVGAWANDRIALWLKGGWLRDVGRATYPLYLIHDVLGAAILRWTSALPDQFALIVAITAVIAISFALLKPEEYLRVRLRARLTRLAGFSFRPRSSRA